MPTPTDNAPAHVYADDAGLTPQDRIEILSDINRLVLVGLVLAWAKAIYDEEVRGGATPFVDVAATAVLVLYLFAQPLVWALFAWLAGPGADTAFCNPGAPGLVDE